jgi:hypothetical protein
MSDYIEDKSDVEKGSDGVVKRWMLEIAAADKAEKDWRKTAEEAINIFHSDSTSSSYSSSNKGTFNILWANTETVRPALYNSAPKADVRRRYRDKDPVGKAVSEVCERAVNYTIDCQDFNSPMINAVNDMLLPGRAITRVRYVPSFTPTDKKEEEVEEVTENAEGEELNTEVLRGSEEDQRNSDDPTEELVYEENIKFKKMMTCVFKKTDYKRIFRFGITTDNKFFYREPLTFNKEIVGFTKEKLFLTKKNNIYILKITKEDEKLSLEINFEEKKSNLSKDINLLSKVNCK